VSADNPFTLTIEPAREEHLIEIATLARIIWRAHYPGIISPEQIDYMLQRFFDLEVLRFQLREGTRFDRALVNGRLAGFSAFHFDLNLREVKLGKLYVHPDWQRRGIGRALLESCEKAAQERRASLILLNVNKRNERAIAAYRKHGFTIRESVVVDIGNGFVMDDYVMTRRVS
jgi:diamine N-acetyltransferase